MNFDEMENVAKKVVQMAKSNSIQEIEKELNISRFQVLEILELTKATLKERANTREKKKVINEFIKNNLSPKDEIEKDKKTSIIKLEIKIDLNRNEIDVEILGIDKISKKDVNKLNIIIEERLLEDISMKLRP